MGFLGASVPIIAYAVFNVALSVVTKKNSIHRALTTKLFLCLDMHHLFNMNKCNVQLQPGFLLHFYMWFNSWPNW